MHQGWKWVLVNGNELPNFGRMVKLLSIQRVKWAFLHRSNCKSTCLKFFESIGNKENSINVHVKLKVKGLIIHLADTYFYS